MCAPQLPDSQDLVSCQGQKETDLTALAPEPASRPVPCHRQTTVASCWLLEQTDFLALKLLGPGGRGWGEGGFPSALLGGDTLLEVNPRVVATRGQFGPELCPCLSGKPGSGCVGV